MAYLRTFLCEFVGTFFFLGTISSVVQQSSGSLGPLFIGAALSTAIYITGGVSGGHFNPAVTLMDYTASKLQYWEGHATTVPLVVVYLTAQIAAGQVGLLMFHQVLRETPPPPLP
jgi:glycerol uptake facilitator-like aquaporin